MKRLFCAMLALLVLTASLPALADPKAYGFPEEDYQLARDVELAVDLDGDGRLEAVSWSMVPGEYDTYLTLTVIGADGAEQTYDTYILWNQAVYVLDLDGDGLQEILMTGDMMSDDYFTYCLHYEDGVLYEVLFPDCARGENNDGYYKMGYGLITAVSSNRVTLSGSQDVLGTWFASRTMALTPYSRFEFDDDGLWVRNLEGFEDDSLWTYGAMTLTASLPYADALGNPAGVLEPGTKLVICATDKQQTARFVTRDGTTGSLSISPDYERGWGWLVEGVPENECFNAIPYAD